MKKGKFIVIDGTDGSGKATQIDLLVARLKKAKLKVKKTDFPQYDINFFGRLIGEALHGKYGDFISIDPHIASVLYAADRWEASAQIKKWLDAGVTIVANRYVSANQIHQGGKIHDEKERVDFLKWLDTMEFKVFKIPRPDAVLYLDVPLELTQKLLEERAARLAKIGGQQSKLDQAESNLKHLQESKESALTVVQKDNKWFRIECAENNQILTREEIHEKVFFLVSKYILKLKK
ncbi:MAG: tmk [Candidatus Paceibacter sp.]|jgi:dTMP kinase|nr:tmk [Candidatus Paceibacter sp.]